MFSRFYFYAKVRKETYRIVLLYNLCFLNKAFHSILQVIFWLVIPKLIREERVRLIMTILLLMFIFQFLPKVYHSIHIMRKMQKVTGYIFGSIWWGFGLNLFAYFIASHVSIPFLNSYLK
jgi:cyclic nucleotide gated channel, plant